VRELHVVAVSEDGRHVLLGATKGTTNSTYRVRLDARLISAVRGDLGHEPTVELSPKDIQARLRAGESAEHIARSAGVAITRVERFAGPVAGEMARMIDAARDACVVRGRLGPSTVALGKAVDASTEGGTWSARREEDGRWRVALAWHARGRDRTAAWFYDPATKGLVGVDPASTALGHVEAAGATHRRAAAPKPAGKPAAKPAAEAGKAVGKPGTKAASKKAARSAAKPAAQRSAAKVVKPVAKPAAKSAAAPTKPVKAAKQAPKPAARASRAAQPAPEPRKAKAAAPARPRLQVVPDHTPKATVPSTAVPSTAVPSTAAAKSRASVPAWADVLLGTTPGADR
jgi:hypothetical protein